MRKIILSIFIVIVGLVFPSTAFAKDYSIKSADFNVQIEKDGSAAVTETRVYSFDGSFSWADQWIPLKGRTISDIKITGANNFTTAEESDRVYIKWYYAAFNEEKTFTLAYKIKKIFPSFIGS